MSDIKGLRESLNQTVAVARSAIAAFIVDLDKDAAHALAWSQPAFAYAADIRVSNEILHSLDLSRRTPGESSADLLDRIANHIQHKINKLAMGDSPSTSEAANVMARAELAAWSRALHTVRRNS